MRQRIVKPELWQHHLLSKCSLEAHVFAAAILNYADDMGYFKWNAAMIQGALFPNRSFKKPLSDYLQELVEAGFIEPGHDSEGRKLGRIINFLLHQTINRPSESYIEDCFISDSVNIHGVISDGSHGDSLSQVPSPKSQILKPKSQMRVCDSGVDARMSILMGKWNEFALKNNLPKIQSITGTRRRHVLALEKKLNVAELMDMIFKEAEQSDFLMGRATDFKLAFDWILNETNRTKILEGNYLKKAKDDPFKTIVPVHLFDKDGKPPTFERPITRKTDE